MDVAPVPKRFWWLKRLLLLSLGVGVGLAGLWTWWAGEARRRLDAAIARFDDEARTEAGEVLPKNGVELQAADEAWGLMARALNTPIVLEDDSHQQTGYFIPMVSMDQYTNGRETWELLLARNRPLLRLVRGARERAEEAGVGGLRVWPRTRESGGGWSARRNLAGLLRLSALNHQIAENDAEMVETFVDLLAYSEAMQYESWLPSQIIADDARGAVFNILADPATEMAIEGCAAFDPPGERTGTPVKRERIEALISVLLDDGAIVSSLEGAYRSVWDIFLAGLRGRRASFGFAGSPGWRARVQNVIDGCREPLVDIEAADDLDRVRAFADATRCRDWPSALDRLPPRPERQRWVYAFVWPLSAYSDRQLRIPLENRYWLLIQQRFAATGLALRLYVCDHGGPPASLAELVPDYLPRVPVDPCSPDGAAIQYIRDEGGVVLSSVGFGARDQGGLVISSLVEEASDSGRPIRLRLAGCYRWEP